MRNISVLGFLLVFLVGCIPPGAEMLQTAFVETQNGYLMMTKTSLAKELESISQTQSAKPTFTSTPKFTPTPTETPIPSRLITATAIQATKQYIAGYETIVWKELKDYPDNHRFEKIKIKGSVFQIINATDMMLLYPGTNDAFYVSFAENYSGVYENQTITIYGTVEGQFCYDTQAGDTNCVPKINGEWFVK